MAQVAKIDSNSTGLRFAEEASLKVLPGSPVWTPLEPNSYADFGQQITTVARNPINNSRQRKKGVTTDLDASGGFNSDWTQENLQSLLQGFMFADFRPKGEEIVTAVDEDTVNPDEYEVASTTGFQVGNLIEGKNFTNAANNAVNVVTAIVVDTSVEVATGQLVAEPTPPADAQITVVGFQFGSGEVDIDQTSQPFPRLVRVSGTTDFTTFGLIPGEMIFVGGDLAAEQFVNAANNGLCRVKQVAATFIEFDKTSATMVDETGTGLTIRLFFGRVLKNESTSALIKRRSYQLERQLGAPDDASPSQIQAEYLVGAIPGEISINVPSNDKITMDLSFVGLDVETVDGPTALKSGTRPALVEASAFNTSSDFSRFRLYQIVDGNAFPSALFSFVQEITLTVNNNLTPNKAVSVLGAFDVTAGSFIVSGSITAYFANIAAVTAIRNNADITMDFFIAKENSGIAVDVPLITLGDGRPNVEQDAPITLPLTTDAASGAKIDPNMDHTLMMVFFDFLPTLAQT